MRAISNYFLESLKCGELEGLTDVIKKNKTNLVLTFREQSIEIYYSGCRLLRVDEQKNAFKCYFSAGYYKNPKPGVNNTKEVKDLKIKSSGQENGSLFEFKILKNKTHSINFNDIVDIIKKFIDNYKNENIEFKAKQKIFCDNFDDTVKEGYICFDFEYHQSNKSATGSLENSGAPDLLAIKVKDGRATDIVMIEVKSKKDACYGTNGINKHLDDFTDIKRMQSQSNRIELLNNMYIIFNYYNYLGLINFNNTYLDYSNKLEIMDEDKFSIKGKIIKYLFVFTDEVSCEIDLKTELKSKSTDDLNAFDKLINSQKRFFSGSGCYKL